MKRFITSWLALFLLAALSTSLCGCTRPQSPPNIVEGTLTHTAPAGGQWQVCFNAAHARLLTGNRDALWFCGGTHIWRYNVRQQRIDVVTSPLTHPGLFGPRYWALAQDGRFACSAADANYLWTPAQGWSRLPQGSGITNEHAPAFSPSGALWIGNYTGMYRWDQGSLSIPKPLKLNDTVLPVGNQWMLWPAYTLTLYDENFETRTDSKISLARYRSSIAHHCINGETFIIAWVRPADSKSSQDATYALAKMTTSEAIELLTADHLGLDLATGQAFRLIPDGAALLVQTPQGAPVTTFAQPPGFSAKNGLYTRDANGHYWFGRFRYDGHRWQAILPANAFEYAGDLPAAVASGRLIYDESRKNWRDQWPEIPVDTAAFDPVHRTGWLQAKASYGPMATVTWEQVHFAPDGAKQVLQRATFDTPYWFVSKPRFADGRGAWWFAAQFRFDGQSVQRYEDGYKNVSGPDDVTPDVYLSSAGTVWRCRPNKTWERFDPLQNAFAPASPYDEFAFTLGPRTLSIVGHPQMNYGGPQGMVYAKTNAWEPLLPPCASSMPDAQGRLFTGPGTYLRGPRLLVTAPGGSMEWDAVRDQWAYLQPFGQHTAMFDPRGRRIFVAEYYDRILMYEGDPLAAPRPPLDASKLEPLVAALDRPESCADATRDLMKILHQNGATAADALRTTQARQHLSPQALTRFNTLLGQSLAKGDFGQRYDAEQVQFQRRLGNSLFERAAHPLTPTFPGGYRISIGMPLDTALSIFHAAGAVRSVAVHNARYPNASCLAFVKPDNTVVYVQVDQAAKPPAILRLGLGAPDEGPNLAWPWDDQSANNLPAVELEPSTWLGP